MKKVVLFLLSFLATSASYAIDFQGQCSDVQIAKLKIESKCEERGCACWYGTNNNDSFTLDVPFFNTLGGNLPRPTTATIWILLNNELIGRYNIQNINLFFAGSGDDVINTTPDISLNWEGLPNGWFQEDIMIQKTYKGPIDIGSEDSGSEVYFFDGLGCDKMYGNPYRDHYFRETPIEENNCDQYYTITLTEKNARASRTDKVQHPDTYQQFNKDEFTAVSTLFDPFEEY